MKKTKDTLNPKQTTFKQTLKPKSHKTRPGRAPGLADFLLNSKTEPLPPEYPKPGLGFKPQTPKPQNPNP